MHTFDITIRLFRNAVIAGVLAIGLENRCPGRELGERELQAAAIYSRERGGLTLLVMHGDAVIFKDYKGSASEPHKIYSGTKSFWGIAAMIAVQERILSLDEKVSETITEWKSDPRKVEIQVRQLLDFSDGLDPGFFLHGNGVADRNLSAIGLPLVAKPRTRFIYGPSHPQVFGELLRRKLISYNDSPFDYLRRKVLLPLGLGSVKPKEDALRHPLMASGFKMTALQWARLGTMILQHGSYRGTAIIPARFLHECFHSSAANPSFGLTFWLNREAGSRGARESDIEEMLELKWHQADWSHVCLCRDAPPDMIASIGSGYQRLYVIPSLDLVIVRQGMNAKFSDGDFLRILLGVTDEKPR